MPFVNPTFQGFDLGRALEQAQAPINTAAQNQLAFSLNNLARRRQLEDIASSREFSETEAERASERRMREFGENERVRLAQKYSELGVSGIKADMSTEDLNSKYQDWLKNKASVQLDVIRSQMQSAEDKQHSALQDVVRVMNSKMGTPQDRREALQVALADPSARAIPTEWRTQLQKALVENKDPEQAVQAVVQRMQDRGSKLFGFLPGMRGPTRAFGEASAFFSSYSGALSQRVQPQQQAELLAKMKVLDDTNKQAEALNQQAWTHIGNNAAFLPKDTIQEWTDRLGVANRDPNDIMKDVAGTPGAGGKPGGGGPPASSPTTGTGTTPPPTPSQPGSPPPTEPNVDQILSGKPPPPPAQATGTTPPPFPGVFGMGANNPPPPNPFDIIGDGNSPEQQGTASANAMPISPKTVAANAIRLSLMQDPKPQPLWNSPQDIDAALQVNTRIFGGAPENNAILKQRAMSGDPQATAAVNFLLKQARTRSASGGAVDPNAQALPQDNPPAGMIMPNGQ